MGAITVDTAAGGFVFFAILLSIAQLGILIYLLLLAGKFVAAVERLTRIAERAVQKLEARPTDKK